MIKLACFLGNPGQQYIKTRHNFPWMILEYMNYIEASSWVNKFKGEYQKVLFNRTPVYILKPLTFMNKSGESLAAAAAFFKIKPEEILVVYDDIELNFGCIELKKGGGLKGHNGLKSIKTHLGNDFLRLRLGIGYPQKGDVSSHVLGRFSKEEEISLPLITERSAALLKEILTDEKALNSNLNNKISIL